MNVGRCGVASCPCNDGDPCNYEDSGDSKAMRHPSTYGTARERSMYFGELHRRIILAAPESERIGLECGARYVLFRRGVELGVITQADHDAAREHYGRLWNYTGD